jgi:hypothetical protein
LDTPISIDVELISFITGLSSNGDKSMQYMDDKTKETTLVEEMKKKYGIEICSCDIIIK